MDRRRLVLITAANAALTGAALAQEQIVASLPFITGMETAGPVCADYEPPQDPLDVWVIEDFVLAQPVRLARFESRGTIWTNSNFVYDVNVRVYRGWPPQGEIAASSVPGAGTVTPLVPFGDQTFRTQFAGSFLPAGSYHLVWNAATVTSAGQRPLWWHHPGPHVIGGGVTANAWKWNPNGGLGWPDNIVKVPANLMGTGQSGVNFVLFGELVDCYPDCNNDGALTVADFGCFQTAFTAGDPYADCNADGAKTVADFGCFQTLFVAGCP